MKANLVWEMSVPELERKEQELHDQIFKLRFQLATGQMDNPLKLRLVRKDLARIKTVLSARRRSAAEASQSEEETKTAAGPGAGNDQVSIPGGEETS